MSRTLFPAAMLTLSLAAGGFAGSVNAGHAMNNHADRAAWFAAHHDFMRPGSDAASKPRLGVAISALSQAQLDAGSLEYGVQIERVVEDSIAATAGLEAGDIVTEFGERPVYSPERLQHLVNNAAGVASLAVVRGGESIQVSVDLTPPAAATAAARAALGIRIQNMTADLKEAFGTQGDRGVLIARVLPDSAAGAAGLKAGDVVVKIGGKNIARVDDVHAALAQHAPGDSLMVTVLRERARSEVTVTLGAAAVATADAGEHAGGRGHGHHGKGPSGHYGQGMHGGHGYAHPRWHGGHAKPGCYSGTQQRRS